MSTKHINPDDWMTQKEASEYLGISRQAIDAASQTMRNRGPKIRVMELAGKIVYNRHDVMKYQVRPKYRNQASEESTK